MDLITKLQATSLIVFVFCLFVASLLPKPDFEDKYNFTIWASVAVMLIISAPAFLIFSLIRIWQ